MKRQLAETYAPIRPHLKQVDLILKESINSKARLIPRISNHLMGGGGKRIRPALLLASAQACGCRGGKLTWTLAAAVELLHTATLLHDDVVDGSEKRRGRPSAHTVYGNSASILVGDFILAQSVALLLGVGDLEMARPLAEVTVRLAEGEAAQLSNRGLIPKDRDYISIITNKTAILFSASCKMGALAARAKKSEVNALADYGLYFGLAFQLIDDCLDYFPGPGGAGKDWGRDINEGKATLPLLVALKSCTPAERGKILRLIKSRVHNNSHTHPLSAGAISEVRNFIQKYRGFDHTREQAQEYTDTAKSKLKKIRPVKKRKLLEELADVYLNRQS